MPVSPTEHRFWLRILEEHGLFIYDHLSPRERQPIRAAEGFVESFAGLRRRVDREAAMGREFAREALELCMRFRQYKINLLADRMRNDIIINLTPAFFNGIIAELEEYTRLLTPLSAGQEPAPASVLHQLFLWIPDQIGHAALLVKDLDLSERELSRLVAQAQQGFTESYLTAIQMAGFARTEGAEMPHLEEFALGLLRQVQSFYRVVQDTVALYKGERLLSRTGLPFLEHHFSETDYFLVKMAEGFPSLAQEFPSLFRPPQPEA